MPVTFMHGPRSVAASRTRGLRAVAFGVAMMLVAQTWSTHCGVDHGPTPSPTEGAANPPTGDHPGAPRRVGIDADAQAR